MFEIDNKQIKEFEAELKTFATRAYPFATKKMINQLAFNTQRRARTDIKKKFVLRNAHTVRSIQVIPTRTLNVNRQTSRVGSTEPYMEDQEFGGIETSTGKHGVNIPTSSSAGQGRNAQPRTKLPVEKNQLRNIRLNNKRFKAKNRKILNMIIIKNAAKTNRKVVFLDTGRNKGFYRVINNGNKESIEMLYNSSKKSISISKSPWLSPAYNKANQMRDAIYRKALLFQLKRHRLFIAR